MMWGAGGIALTNAYHCHKESQPSFAAKRPTSIWTNLSLHIHSELSLRVCMSTDACFLCFKSIFKMFLCTHLFYIGGQVPHRPPIPRGGSAWSAISYLLNLNGLRYISFSVFQCHYPILSNMDNSIFKIHIRYWCRGFSVFSTYQKFSHFIFIFSIFLFPNFTCYILTGII